MTFAAFHAVLRPLGAGLAAAALCLGSAAGSARAQDDTVVIGGPGPGSVTVDLSVIGGAGRAPARGQLLFPGSRVKPNEPIVLRPPGARAGPQSPPTRRARPLPEAPAMRPPAPPKAAARPNTKAPGAAGQGRDRAALTPPPMTRSEPAPSAPPAAAPRPPRMTPPSGTAGPEPEAAPTPPKAAEKSAPKAPAPARETASAMPPPPPPPASAAPRTPVSPSPLGSGPAPAPRTDRPAEQMAGLPKAAAIVPGSSHRILFPPGSARLPEDGRGMLDRVAAALAGNPALRVQLSAYARGGADTVSQARRLSLSRALAIRSHLIKGGVRATRIDVRALGNKVPDGPPNRVDLSVVTR